MGQRHVVNDRYCKKCARTLKVNAKDMRTHGDQHRFEELEKWRIEYNARPAPKPMESIGEVDAE